MKQLSLLRYLKEFGIRCTILKFASRLFPYSKSTSSFRWRIQQEKHRMIMDYLYKHYYLKARKDDGPYSKINPFSQNIWTAWLQGEENAPESIRLTIASMRKNAGGHNVVVITNDNIDDYIIIPQEIKMKYIDGIIGHAHYADIIRVLILSKYGGIWLDATTFLYRPIDERAFNLQFYSMGFESNKKARYVSDHKWIVGHIGCCKDSIFLSIISKMLVSYWKEHNILIDYFLFDYCIAVLYKNDTDFKSVVDKLMKQKRTTYELEKIIDEPYNEAILCDLLSENDIYILSYRKKHIKQNEAGMTTNYGFLYDQYLG